MKILGIRTSPHEIRYAVLEKTDDGQIIFVNQNSENRLKYPASVTEIDEKLKWIKDELDRVFRQTQKINQVVLKMNEYAGTETGAKRESAYVDAICILSAVEHQVPIIRKTYAQIGSISAKVKVDAETRIGRTSQYWDNKIADAILAAFWEIRRG